MGTGAAKLAFRSNPTVILMAGLQGSGKTTTCAKLAQAAAEAGPQAGCSCLRRLPPGRHRAAADGRRAGRRAGLRAAVPTSTRSRSRRWGVQQARQQGRDTVILDTAGRLHVDDELMARAGRIREAVKPDETLLVARRDDRPGRGQRRRGVPRAGCSSTGIVLTKLDGDARGGAALSIARRHRHADQVRRRGREARRSSRSSTPTAWPRASSAWATCSRSIEQVEETVDREAGRAAGGEAPQARVHARRPPRAAAARSGRWARSAV